LPNTGTKTVGVWAAVVALLAGSMLVIVNKKNSQA
ncbi:MAG: LPXTG cell wall anchor domain-containing protein, partial [Streptococcus sp.]|nr:LPXTG cell wall anchor domain-containing protein [Streptococcus sp.]